MDDIEDIFVRGQGSRPSEGSAADSGVDFVTKRKKRAADAAVKKNEEEEEEREREREFELENSIMLHPPSSSKTGPRETIVGDVPWTESILIKTQGCAHNTSDSEYMAGLLAERGYRIVHKENDNPDVYIFNSCTVKGPSQDSFLHSVRNLRAQNKCVIVAGCVPQGQPSHPDLDGLSMIGVQQIGRVVEVVENAIKGNVVRLAGQRTKPRLDLPKIRANSFVEVVPVSVGCLNHCTYCKTKHARGNLNSYEPQAIVDRIKTVIDTEGVLEIRLTSEDTGAYGRDIGQSLPSLLERIVAVIPEGTMLRVGMTNPPYMLEHIEAIAEILAHPRVFSFLHVPVQAGSDSVLARMKREYTAADFCRVVDILTARIPTISIATDIICGFPDETDEDFEETMKLIEKYRLPFVNISQFYPRPGTAAAKMKRVPTEKVKERSRKITQLVNSFTNCFDHLMGTEQHVWLSGELSSDRRYRAGHTKSYVQVLLSLEDAPLAGEVVAEITQVQRWCVVGKVIRVVRSVNERPRQEIAVVERTEKTDEEKRGVIVGNGMDGCGGEECNDDDGGSECCGGDGEGCACKTSNGSNDSNNNNSKIRNTVSESLRTNTVVAALVAFFVLTIFALELSSSTLVTVAGILLAALFLDGGH